MAKGFFSRRHQAQVRRQELIDAALHLFAEKGYDGASIRDIARRAGVTEALVYHYFRSKEHLFEEVIKARSFAPVLRQVLNEMENAHPSAVLRQVMEEFLDMLWYNASMARMFIIEFMRNPICARYFRAIVEENTANLAQYLQEQQHRGVFRADIDAQAVAEMLLGMAFSLFFAWGQASERDWHQRRQRFLHHSVPLVLHSLYAHPPQAKEI